jgi:outer membrane protein assembly factor BamA
VEVVFEATPGPVFYFGDVIVEGADDDVVPLVVKSISAKNGTQYSPDRLDNSEKNLRVLGLFRQIRLELSEVANDTLDVVAQLTMREPRRLEAGVRYWSEEKLDGGARWTHRNLFKHGRGGAVTISASSVRQRFDVSAWWPAILVARSRLSTTVGINRETEESYTQLDTGGDVTLSYNFGLRSRILLGLLLSNVDVIEATDATITDIEQDGFLAAWSFVAEEDRGNDPIVPTRGTYTRVRAEWAPKYEFTDYHYIKIEPTVSAYVGVPRTKTTVFAVRLTLGGADPLGESVDLLPSKRFYSGGATSMRGFQRRKLGPLDSGGAPIGGEALFESSGELRFPMFWRLRGAVFVDAGQVWPTIDDVRTDNIEVAVGVGLWFTTAIGPIRVDYGYRLTDYEKSQRRYAYHFSIGPAF